MSGVQQIKDPVGEDDSALSGAPDRGGLGRANFRGGVQSGCVALGWNVNVCLNSGSDTLSLYCV